MKRIIKITIAVLCIFMISACSNNELSMKEFSEQMSMKGYSVKDISKQYKDNKNIKEVYSANKDNTHIDYYKCKSVEGAKTIYDNYKKMFISNNSKVIDSKSLDDKDYYKIESNGINYVYFSRIDKNVMFSFTELNNKESVDEIIKSFNY